VAQFEFKLRSVEKPVLGETAKVDEMITCIIKTFRNSFPSSHDTFRFPVNLLPHERMDDIEQNLEKPGILTLVFISLLKHFFNTAIKSCGGFIKVNHLLLSSSFTYEL
jgi:hypothetical protein